MIFFRDFLAPAHILKGELRWNG